MSTPRPDIDCERDHATLRVADLRAATDYHVTRARERPVRRAGRGAKSDARPSRFRHSLHILVGRSIPGPHPATTFESSIRRTGSRKS